MTAQQFTGVKKAFSALSFSNVNHSHSGNLFFAAGALAGIAFILSSVTGSFSPSDRLDGGELKHHAKTITPLEVSPTIAAGQVLERVEVPLIAEPELAVGSVQYDAAFGPQMPEYMRDKELVLEIKPGDTLIDLLVDGGMNARQAYLAIEAMKPVFSPRKIRVGQQVQIVRRPGASLEQAGISRFTLDVSPLQQVIVESGEEGFRASMRQRTAETATARARGVINSSFYQAAQDAGLDARVIMELMNAFSYDVDFQRDIKSGQHLEVLFEQHLDKHKQVIAQGDVQYARFNLGGQELEIYRYEDSEGNVGFYHPNGESVRTALLRTPVNGARISSGYGLRRHPVLGYSKMHKGIDFAAPTGTPVYAAGDGVVKKAKRWGGYGNYLKIEHNGTYATAYAHLHRFAKGVRPGKRVKQGQVIAYVGSTGRSTGPHLHYEILKYGKQTNPSKVKFKSGRKLKGRELAAFKKQQQEWRSMLASLPPLKTQVASAE